MARIISEIRPCYVFVENSPLLVSRGLDVVLSDLAEMGYDATWGVVSAKNAVSAQERERLWVLAYADEERLLPVQIQRRVISTRSFDSEYKRVLMETLSDKDFTSLTRDPDAMARWVVRFEAIGNGQVPAVAALAWRILTGENA